MKQFSCSKFWDHDFFLKWSLHFGCVGYDILLWLRTSTDNILIVRRLDWSSHTCILYMIIVHLARKWLDRWWCVSYLYNICIYLYLVVTSVVFYHPRCDNLDFSCHHWLGTLQCGKSMLVYNTNATGFRLMSELVSLPSSWWNPDQLFWFYPV